MIEAVNKRLKYDYLFTKEVPNFETVQTFVTLAINSFNNKPLVILSAFTPLEVLHGAIPNKNRYKESLKIAVIERRQTNRQQKCCA